MDTEESKSVEALLANGITHIGFQPFECWENVLTSMLETMSFQEIGEIGGFSGAGVCLGILDHLDIWNR